MEGVESRLKEEPLESEKVETVRFLPPYPEKAFWLRTADGFESTGAECLLVSGDVKFGGFGERLENRFEDRENIEPPCNTWFRTRQTNRDEPSQQPAPESE